MSRVARRSTLLGGIAAIALVVAAVLPTVAGPLADKARAFDTAIEAHHLPNGLVFDVVLDDEGKLVTAHGGGDSSIWTGAYAAAQAWRYRVTRDRQALTNIERVVQAFHTLQEVTGYPGFCGRAWGEAPWFPRGRDTASGTGPLSNILYYADTSRDQYTGLFLGYALTWPLLDKPALKTMVQADVRAMARNLIDHNLALMSRVNGAEKSQFNLNPTYCYQDRINPHEWAVVDDFPANVFARIVPFDERLARALATLSPPPMRGGEALRALMMLGTAATITADLDIQRFYRDELWEQRDFPRIASETSQLVEDAYRGLGTDRLARVCGGIAVALFDVAGEIVVEVDGVPRPWLRLFMVLPRHVVRTMGERAGHRFGAFMRELNRPGAMRAVLTLKGPLERLANLEVVLGSRRLSARLQGWLAHIDKLAASDLDAAADAMRSYVGCNLTFFALVGLLETETDPRVRSAAIDLLERAFEPLADEGNALYTYIRAAFSRRPLPPAVLAAAKETLQRYPSDQRLRRFDHTKTPGLQVLPWPDRFGRIGNQARHPFPIDQRPPDIFPWQRDPRQIVTGADHPEIRIAPVGYLMAYWFARAHGLLNEND